MDENHNIQIGDYVVTTTEYNIKKMNGLKDEYFYFGKVMYFPNNTNAKIRYLLLSKNEIPESYMDIYPLYFNNMKTIEIGIPYLRKINIEDAGQKNTNIMFELTNKIIERLYDKIYELEERITENRDYTLHVEKMHRDYVRYKKEYNKKVAEIRWDEHLRRATGDNGI